MTFEKLDRDLAAWGDRQRLIEENLNSFVELPACRRICGQDLRSPRPFTGETESAVAAAFAVLGRLREQQGLLDRTLRRARELRESLSRLVPSRQTLDAIESILSGPSVELGIATTPPSRRELMRNVDTPIRVSLDELADMMTESFRYFRDTVLSVATAQDQNADEVEHLQYELKSLRATGGTGNLAKSVEEAVGMSKLDPLAAATRLAGVAQQIQSMLDSAKTAERRNREMTDALAAADSLIARVRDEHSRATKVVAERISKVAPLPGASIPRPADDADVAGIDRWLETLRATIAGGDVGPASIGLRNWRRAAEKTLAADRSAADAAEAALRDRRDLRGLFGALKAKASAAPGTPAAQLAAEIEHLFAQRPTPMDRAKELVSRYQRQIS